jgi:hypothetical protein
MVKPPRLCGAHVRLVRRSTGRGIGAVPASVRDELPTLGGESRVGRGGGRGATIYPDAQRRDGFALRRWCSWPAIRRRGCQPRASRASVTGDHPNISGERGGGGGGSGDRPSRARTTPAVKAAAAKAHLAAFVLISSSLDRTDSWTAKHRLAGPSGSRPSDEQRVASHLGTWRLHDASVSGDGPGVSAAVRGMKLASEGPSGSGRRFGRSGTGASFGRTRTGRPF